MKKTTKIVTLALIIVALLSAMCGCNTENTNNHNYKKEEISSTVETDNTYIEEVDTSKLSYYATYDHVAFYKGEQEQWYAYIENWGEYRKLGNIKGEIYDALLGENTIEVIFTDFGYEKETIVTTIKLTRNADEVSSYQNNSESIQTKQYQYFYRAIEENPYDKWLKNELEKGERAEKTIYAEYLAFWKDELAFTIESGEVIFDDKEQYEQWKSDIQQWLVISQDILKNEMNMMNYSLGQLEVIIPYCEMVRQKAIDAKRFIYYYQIYNTLTPYTNIEINWCSK